MIRIEKYTGKKTYMFPNGAIATPEVVANRYPAVNQFAHLVETDESGEVMYALQNFAAMRSMHGISSELGEAAAIAAIEEAVNAVPEEVISAEERIAAALEFNNLMNMEG